MCIQLPRNSTNNSALLQRGTKTREKNKEKEIKTKATLFMPLLGALVVFLFAHVLIKYAIKSFTRTGSRRHIQSIRLFIDLLNRCKTIAKRDCNIHMNKDKHEGFEHSWLNASIQRKTHSSSDRFEFLSRTCTFESVCASDVINIKLLCTCFR